MIAEINPELTRIPHIQFLAFFAEVLPYSNLGKSQVKRDSNGQIAAGEPAKKIIKYNSVNCVPSFR